MAIRTLRRHSASLILPLLAAILPCEGLLAQRDGPPRRLENPETISLPGGARVEFKSFQSESLGQEVPYSIYLPPSYGRESNRRYPAVYFLHGLFNDHTSWVVERYGNIPARIEEEMREGRIPEFVMVHPAGERGFYTDSRSGAGKYETLVVKDLLIEVEGKYRVEGSRSARVIGGTSMGGYGALKIAMKHPELFSRVAAGSPIILLGDDPLADMPSSENRFGQFIREMIGGVFGDPVDEQHWRENSLENLARQRDLKDLAIYFFYGTADRYGQFIPLEKGIHALDEILNSRQIDHTMKILENGPHGWELVVEDLDSVLSFLTQGFADQRVGN